MALLFDFSAIIEFFSLLAPIIVAAFILFGSILNQNIKGIIYLAGLMLTVLGGILLRPFFKGLVPEGAHAACSIFSQHLPNNLYSNPSLDTLSLTFTFIYILLPMIYNKTLNWMLVVTLLLFTSLNALFRLKNSCNTSMDIIMAILLGGLCGLGYYSLIDTYGGKKYLLFSAGDSNNVVCNKPSDQKFKCMVYKNGEVIRQL